MLPCMVVVGAAAAAVVGVFVACRSSPRLLLGPRCIGWSPRVRCRVVRCRVVGCVSSPVQSLEVLGYLCHRVVLRWLLCEQEVDRSVWARLLSGG